MAGKVLVIGAGNDFRRDDGIGIVVAERLRASKLPAQIFCGEGTELIEAWQGLDLCIIVDASSSGAEPGTITRFDAFYEPIPTQFFHYSTHKFGVAEAVETARVLGKLPKRLVVFAVEGKDFGQGPGLSRAADEGARRVEQMVRDELNGAL